METRNRPGNFVNFSAACLLGLVAAGCASTKETSQALVTGNVPRPGQIWVYDFAATESDIPAESALAGQTSPDATPQTAAQVAEGQKLGAELAAQLVDQIHGMGMPAEHAWSGTRPRVNDLVIHGYLLSVQLGSAKERVSVGLGAGDSELKTAVEGFQMTPSGLRKVGSGDVDATGNKTPGAAVGVLGLIATHNPAGLIISGGMKIEEEKSGSATIEGRVQQTAKEIADVLKKRFQEQGWIQ